MDITYYAPIDTMGDVSEADAVKYRAWAESEIKKEFPAATVEVSDEQGRDYVECENTEDEDRATAFIKNLWDSCPWDWE